MLTLPHRESSILEKAEDRLAGLRRSLLLFAQGRLAGEEMLPACRQLAEFQVEAETAGYPEIGRLAAEAAYSVERTSRFEAGDVESPANAALDLVSLLEEKLLSIPLGTAGFGEEADELLELRFNDLVTSPEKPPPDPSGFEIDDETLEVFHEEADGLLTNIRNALDALKTDPSDTAALWNIRRSAHTLKGAAGAVGLEEASALAHSVEDLLEEFAENERVPDGDIAGALEAAYAALVAATMSSRSSDPAPNVSDLSTAVPDDEVTSPPDARAVHSPPTPVVRVSLDRLDELQDLSAKLTHNAERLNSLIESHAFDADISELLGEQRSLSRSVRSGLQQIRMVRFGVLSMRLNRAVNLTAQEEGKKAEVTIANPDVEVDTLIIDALIEPLLHLLKNAVAHGIERPESRRLVGKPEEGRITVSVHATATGIELSVEDDGRGISIPALIAKAVSSGVLERAVADELDDEDALRLIFERGLTTAESLSLNAGRGVGMSIVKESIEARGGRIAIASRPQHGTTFTIMLPFGSAKPEPDSPAEQTDAPLVLIVDDSSSIRVVTSLLAESLHCRAATAENGVQALQFLEGTEKPDLILSDVEMPVMDGWQLLASLKSSDELQGIPVVMVTSLTDNVSREKAAALGSDGYAAKPLERADLERVLRAAGVSVSA